MSGLRPKKTRPITRTSIILGEAPAGAHPNHSFLVLDVRSRFGELDPSLRTLDSCRVKLGARDGRLGAELVVERVPLGIRDGKLVLRDAQTERVLPQLEGRALCDAAAPGDWVSIHWGWMCEVLTERQQRDLARWSGVRSVIQNNPHHRQRRCLDNAHTARRPLVDQQLAASDSPSRTALVARLQARLAELVPTIPLFYRRFYWVYATDRVHPMNTPGGLMNGVPFVTNKLIFLAR